MSEESLPWTEKYRPQHLSNVRGNSTVVSGLKRLASKGNIPHLLFVGPPGTGKTSTAHALLNDVGFQEQDVLELNASDERGIDTVREKIKNVSRTMPFGGTAFRAIILDEADNITKDAQEALRRIVETETKTCRFILTANEIDGIIEPLKDRLVKFSFGAVSDQDIAETLRDIAQVEGVNISEESVAAITRVSFGSLRSAVNNLQLVAESSKDNIVTIEHVRDTLQAPDQVSVGGIVFLALEGKFVESMRVYYKTFKGYAGARDFINIVTGDLIRGKFRGNEAKIAKNLSSVQMGMGRNDYLQVMGFLARLGDKA